jgi:hypothetical protein
MTAIIDVSRAGESDKPSPSIWGDCPCTILNDKGLGVFVHEDFQAPISIATPTDSAPIGGGAFSFKGDTDTSLTSVADTPGGIIDMETNTTAADAGVIVGNAFAKIVKNSGKKVWFETRVAPGDVDDDMGTFAGLVEEDGADEDVIADDPADNDATADVTLIGYLQSNDDPDAYDALTKNDTSDAVLVKNDVTNATGIPSDDRASLVNGVAATGAGFHKLGIYFGGRDVIEFYVDGYKVATADVDSNIDQDNWLAPIVAVKTGDTAAEKIFVDWIRAAYQERS